MLTRISMLSALLFLAALLHTGSTPSTAHAQEVLISDRLNNSVYRYSSSGTFIGTLLADPANLNQPSGLAVSPDLTKLYVTSSQNNRVMRYDYNYAAGTVSNAMVFADNIDGLQFPNFIKFNAAGDKIYISNLGGSGVVQLNLDGTSGGAPINGSIAGGSVFQYSGLAFGPSGELLVGGFQDFPAGISGAIAKSNAAISSIVDFIAPSTTLNGVGNLLVIGNDLYATAGFAGRVNKYNATTGAVDGAFTPITGLQFPASLIAAPDGNGILVGDLGFVTGGGNILRYGFDGTLIGSFATANANPVNGFGEATGMVAVPEPSSIGLMGIAFAMLGYAARKRLVAKL